MIRIRGLDLATWVGGPAAAAAKPQGREALAFGHWYAKAVVYTARSRLRQVEAQIVASPDRFGLPDAAELLQAASESVNASRLQFARLHRRQHLEPAAHDVGIVTVVPNADPSVVQEFRRSIVHESFDLVDPYIVID